MDGKLRRASFAFAVLGTAAFLATTPAAQQRGFGPPAGPQRTTTPDPLQFRYMGPAPAGRIASAAGVPGDPSTYYLGSASGGVWKTTDAGKTFVPIFDDQDVAAIGSIAVDPNDTNTVWVGTGEPWVIRWSDVWGDGVYMSKDAGKTWKHMGLVDAGRIARVLLNPTDSNTVYVCAEGRLTGDLVSARAAGLLRRAFLRRRSSLSALGRSQQNQMLRPGFAYEFDNHSQLRI